MKEFLVSTLLLLSIHNLSFAQESDSILCNNMVQKFNTAWNEQNWNKVVDLTSEETFEVVPKQTLLSTYSSMASNGMTIVTDLKKIHSSSETIKVGSKQLKRITYLIDFKIFLSGQLLSNIELMVEGAQGGFGKENVSTTDSSITIKRLSSYLLINNNNEWKIMPANSEEMVIVSQFFTTSDLSKIGLPHQEKLSESNNSEEKTISSDNLPWYFQEPSEKEKTEFINRLESNTQTSDDYSLIGSKTVQNKELSIVYSNQKFMLAILMPIMEMKKDGKVEDREIFIYHDKGSLPNLKKVAKEEDFHLDSLMGSIIQTKEGKVILRIYHPETGFRDL